SLERMNRFQEAEARRIIADLALPSASRGLDVGCGGGLYALWLGEGGLRGGPSGGSARGDGGAGRIRAGNRARDGQRRRGAGSRGQPVGAWPCRVRAGRRGGHSPARSERRLGLVRR